MFVPVTTEYVATAIRGNATDPRLIQLVAQVNAYIGALPLQDRLPEEVGNMAATQMVAYLYDAPSAYEFTRYGDAYRNSGAASILKRYTIRRAAALGDVATAVAGAVNAGVSSGNPVVSIESLDPLDERYVRDLVFDGQLKLRLSYADGSFRNLSVRNIRSYGFPYVKYSHHGPNDPAESDVFAYDGFVPDGGWFASDLWLEVTTASITWWIYDGPPANKWVRIKSVAIGGGNAGDGLDVAAVDARIANWAAAGNDDAIPAEKLTNAPAGNPGDGLDVVAVDARVSAGVLDWAEDGNTDTIPDAKIPAGIARDSAIPEIPAAYTLPAAASGTRGGVQAVTNTIIDAGSSTGIFGWAISHVKRVVNAIVPAWAREGNTDAIPAGKLTNAPGGSGSSVRVFVSSGSSNQSPGTSLFQDDAREGDALLWDNTTGATNRLKLYKRVNNAWAAASYFEVGGPVT